MYWDYWVETLLVSSKVSRTSEENLSPEVMYKDKLELLEQLGTLLALLIINSQVKKGHALMYFGRRIHKVLSGT